MGSGSPPLGLNPRQAIFWSPQCPDSEHDGCRPVRDVAGPVPGPECAGGVWGGGASSSRERPARRRREAAVEKARHPSLGGQLVESGFQGSGSHFAGIVSKAKCESYLLAPRTLAPRPLPFTDPLIVWSWLSVTSLRVTSRGPTQERGHRMCCRVLVLSCWHVASARAASPTVGEALAFLASPLLGTLQDSQVLHS